MRGAGPEHVNGNGAEREPGALPGDFCWCNPNPNRTGWAAQAEGQPKIQRDVGRVPQPKQED